MTSILVVDDCPVDRKLIGSLLQKQSNWDIRFAEDGQQALDQIEQTSFDLVVTDLQMPNLDGLELVKCVRQNHSQLPVVLVTSKGSQDIAVEALKLGATNYSPKSKLNRDLFGTAKHVLEFSKQLLQTPTTESQECCFSFVLENDSEMVAPVLSTLESNMPAWLESDRLRVGMAINEAITNAINHGNLEVDSELKEQDETQFFDLIDKRKIQTPYADRRVLIEAEYNKDEICIRISDQGPGFDPQCVADPTCRENLEKLSGRGLLLIHSFMDRVEHNTVGNQIFMVKQRPTAAEDTE